MFRSCHNDHGHLHTFYVVRILDQEKSKTPPFFQKIKIKSYVTYKNLQSISRNKPFRQAI